MTPEAAAERFASAEFIAIDEAIGLAIEREAELYERERERAAAG